MTILTEIKRIRYNDSCQENPVYLSWRNLNGGMNYYLFTRRQVKNIITGNENTIDKYITDFENEESTSEVLSLNADDKWILGVENVDLNDAMLIATLLYSPRVQWLSNPDTWESEGCKWITVLVDRGTFPVIDTGEIMQSITFLIKFQSKVIQEQ